MEWQVWLTFLGAAIAISVSPGAGAILSMATGLSQGLRRSYWAIIGLEIGLMVQLSLVALGLGAVLASSVLAFTFIKWLGVAYLIYLAIRQWRAAETDLRAQLGSATESGVVALVTRGTLVNLTNPKGLIFLLAVLAALREPLGAAGAPIRDHRRHDGGRRSGGDGRLRRPGVPGAAMAHDTAPTTRREPGVLRAVCHCGRGVVTGAPGGDRLTGPATAVPAKNVVRHVRCVATDAVETA